MEEANAVAATDIVRMYYVAASYLGGIFTAVAEQHANSLAKMS